MTSTAPDVRRGPRIVPIAVVFALALLSHVPFIGHEGFYDEFYHASAASAHARTGELAVADGRYDRAAAFTVAMSWLSRAGVEPLMSGRWLSAIAGALLVAAVFAWTAREVSFRAATFAALLLGLSPPILFLSQIARFYVVHACISWVAAVAAYRMLDPAAGRHRRVIAAVTMIVALWMAWHLSLTTMILVAGLGLWAILDLARSLERRAAWRVLGAAAVLGIAAMLAVATIGPLGERIRGIWDFYLRAPLWAGGGTGAYRYYAYWMLESYPTLLTLLPIIAVVAIARRARPAAFGLVILGAGLVLHSIAGAKHYRYIVYLLPFLFVACGIAIDAAWPRFVEWTRVAIRAAAGPRWSLQVSSVAASVVAGGILLGVAAANPASILAARLVTTGDANWPAGETGYRGSSAWTAVPDCIEYPTAGTALVVSAGPKAVYRLGDFDYDLSRTVLAELGGREFAVDHRTGRPVISSADSIRAVVSRESAGWIVIERHHWRNDWAVSDETADVIEALTERVECPARGLVVFRWASTPRATVAGDPE